MKIISFVNAGIESFGLVTDLGIVDLRVRTGLPDVRSLLAAGVERARQFLADAPDFSLDQVDYLPPVPNPLHLLGIGLNTKSHFAETTALMNRKAGDFPPKPRIFYRSPLSVVGSGQPIILPKVSEQLDWEGEIVAVIGKTARYVSPEQAIDHIGGYACGNEGSVRDYQMHSSQVTAGKNFFQSGSWGPYLVTADEAVFGDGPCLELRKNGELRQTLVMSDLIFSFGELVSYISEFIALQPGDAIFTGSPEGIGALSGEWLRNGDVIEVSSSVLGTLINPIQQE